MRNALIIHGTPSKEEYFSDKYPSCSNSHWIPWLQKQLLMRDIFTQTPEMPEAYKPDYKKWKGEFEKFNVDEDSVLIGHSCGGGFLTRWLTENKVIIDKLVLVAPWLDPDRRKTTIFFDFVIDTKIRERVNEIHIFVSDDEDEILKSIEIIKKALSNSRIHRLKDKGHFCYEEMKTEEFPELLKVIE